MKLYCAFCGVKVHLLDTYVILTRNLRQRHCDKCGHPVRERPRGLGFKDHKHVKKNVIEIE